MPIKDPAARAAYEAAYRKKNAETLRAKRREYGKKNPDVARRYRVKYEAQSAERIREQKREYRQRNFRKMAVHYANARAVERGVPGGLRVEDVHWPTHCPVFGTELVYGAHGRRSANSASLDRVVPELGYVKGNVIVVSWRANLIKQDASPAEIRAVADFYEMVYG